MNTPQNNKSAVNLAIKAVENYAKKEINKHTASINNLRNLSSKIIKIKNKNNLPQAVVAPVAVQEATVRNGSNAGVNASAAAEVNQAAALRTILQQFLRNENNKLTNENNKLTNENITSILNQLNFITNTNEESLKTKARSKANNIRRQKNATSTTPEGRNNESGPEGEGQGDVNVVPGSVVATTPEGEGQGGVNVVPGSVVATTPEGEGQGGVNVVPGSVVATTPEGGNNGPEGEGGNNSGRNNRTGRQSSLVAATTPEGGNNGPEGEGGNNGLEGQGGGAKKKRSLKKKSASKAKKSNPKKKSAPKKRSTKSRK